MRVKGERKMKFQILKISDLDKIIDLIEPHQKGSSDMGVGIRGLYKSEINKQYLKQSKVWDDGTPTKERLCGTCACQVVHDWYSSNREAVEEGLDTAADNVKHYGDEHIYALVIGTPQNGAEDIGEIILSAPLNPVGGAEVIAYIDIK
jgi:hypothetical protein